ncbi:hypothetical protein PN36_31450 [Candidatus Thiomargarita nelsonii]|uniref:Uncharacterized protein n=1 Tax=Candidatus Thiomargarita nelsonii TaxID=1003181 RepID=A0A0A6PAV2_9GAMM|nr:hypothetical protein PN36_31450 [Candidatus Thiomargarita nelsonii]
MSKKINWHRAFGLTLTDFFKDSNFEVGLEKEMSVKLQYLDVLIIKKSDGKPVDKLKLPDGFEHLVKYNILTYKSMHQALDHWAIEEVIGHYVSYRKMVSPSKQELLPASDFQVYAVSTRYPKNLLGSKKKLNPEIEEIQAGVYKVLSKLICPVIILVLSEMLKDDKNALWQLFSGKADGFEFGNVHYQWHDPSSQALLNQLYKLYSKEGVVMSYTWDDYFRDYPPEEFLRKLPPEAILKGISDDVILKIPDEKRLKGISPEVIKKYLSSLSQ